MSGRPVNVLSVDVEEYYDAEIFADILPRDSWKSIPSRVETNSLRLVDLFDAYAMKATFFVLGHVAERCPGLVRTISSRGHEIASHGYGHAMLTRSNPVAFREDLRKSRKILENITGAPVTGYRAPTFSILESTQWAYDVLAEEGFRYSSSVFPIRHDRYGWPGFGESPRKMGAEGSRKVWEIPMTVRGLGKLQVPFGGGGYLRLYPLLFTQLLMNHHFNNGKVCIVYLHPWELDLEHPKVPLPFLKRIRHYAGISRMEMKLRALLDAFPFGTMSAHVDALESAA